MADIIPPDPYLALGIDRTATADEIKKAYRKAALRCHPDKTKDQAKIDEFHRIQHAYDILGDDEKRQVYEATLRLHSLRKEMGRSSSYAASPRDPTKSTARPTSYDDKPRAKTGSGWTSGWSSRAFRSEERVPPKQPEFVPPPRAAPAREPVYDDDFLDRNELNRSTSRKDDSYYSSTRRPTQPKPAKADSSKASKAEKTTTSKDKERRDVQKQREREKERERGRKYGPAMGAPLDNSDSSDDGHFHGHAPASRSKPQHFPEPRRRSDTTGLKEASSRRSDEDESLDGPYRRKYADKEDFVRSYRIQSGDPPRARSPPPASYRAPPEPETGYIRRSSSTARGGLFRRPSSSSKPSPAKTSTSRPPIRRPSPVRRASRSHEDLEPTSEPRRTPSMPTSYSSPTGATIKLPDDKRGRSYDLPRSRPSMRHADTMPSPRSSAERVEQEERDRLYERSDREKGDWERTSVRPKLSRPDSERSNLERSMSGGRRSMPRRHYPDDATPVVSSNLRHGENNDSGYSTSSPSETPVEHFPATTPPPKSKAYQYAKVEDPYVAEVRAPTGGARRGSSPVREKQTSFPPSVTVNERVRRPAISRTSSHSSQPPSKPGLVRRSSHSYRGESEDRPRIPISRGETMPSLPSRGREYAIPPPPLQTGYKVSDGKDGFLFGQQLRAASPDEMSPIEASRREVPAYRVPASEKVSYAKHYAPDDVAYAQSGASLGRRNSSARAANTPPERYRERVIRPRRETEAY